MPTWRRDEVLRAHAAVRHTLQQLLESLDCRLCNTGYHHNALGTWGAANLLQHFLERVVDEERL